MADRIIIHVDMDAFYASVEVRDDPSLRGKPLIIGSLPGERGVVSTCSYEAREYGVRSAMNIKEAYSLCPNGVYMHPNMVKYKDASRQIHRIWRDFTPVLESIALDEAYLDVTETAKDFDSARVFAHEIKRRTLDEVGLTCSVGLSYCMAGAKTASEEMKPDGYFEILTPEDFMDLVMDRDVRVLSTVGERSAERLQSIGIETVRDILERQDEVVELLGDLHGRQVVKVAQGIDDREVTPWEPQDAKSIGREITFQDNVWNYRLVEDVLLLLAANVADQARRAGLRGGGVMLKLTYANGKGISKSRVTANCGDALSIHKEAMSLLESVERKPLRLVGVGVYNLSKGSVQTTLDVGEGTAQRVRSLKEALGAIEGEYRIDLGANMRRVYRLDTLHAAVEEMRKNAVWHGPRPIPIFMNRTDSCISCPKWQAARRWSSSPSYSGRS